MPKIETFIENTYKNHEIPEKSMKNILDIIKYNAYGSKLGMKSAELYPLCSLINHSEKEKNIKLESKDDPDIGYHFAMIIA